MNSGEARWSRSTSVFQAGSSRCWAIAARYSATIEAAASSQSTITLRQTGSEKLKDRAKRILGVVTGLDPDQSEALLNRAKWNVKAAIVMEKAGLTLPQAVKRLRKADNSIREALGEDIEPRLRQLLGI